MPWYPQGQLEPRAHYLEGASSLIWIFFLKKMKLSPAQGSLHFICVSCMPCNSVSALKLTLDTWHTWGQVLLSICSLLTDANPQDPLVANIATQYISDRSGRFFLSFCLCIFLLPFFQSLSLTYVWFLLVDDDVVRKELKASYTSSLRPPTLVA